MSEMIVQVRNKMLRRIGGANHFVSHNKDYTIQFQFDESWDNVRTKMAVFAYEDGEYGSEIFDGDTCNVPELPREGRILIGVKAGEDLSTELLCIPVCKSADDVITDEYDEPDPKIYEQILDIINNLWNGGTTVYPSPVRFLAAPSTAKVGDLIRVKEVDENGDVTRTEGFDVGAELEKKINAPQTAAVGEVLTVEEIGDDGKPKKWKTAPAAPEQKQADWAQNDTTAADYVKNRPFYKTDAIHLGDIVFNAVSTNKIKHTIDEMSMNVLNAFNSVINSYGRKAQIELLLCGKSYTVNVTFNRGTFSFNSNEILGNVHYNIGSEFYFKVEDNSVVFEVGKSYSVSFFDINDQYVKIPFDFFPNNIFTQESAPVRYGEGVKATIQGNETTASGDSSHAEGSNTKASGPHSHAEGWWSESSGYNSHAEGYSTKASGSRSHAEGYKTEASGSRSHAEGSNTKASGGLSHVRGMYNIFETGDYSYEVLYTSLTVEKKTTYYAANSFEFNTENGVFTLLNASVLDFPASAKRQYISLNAESSLIYRLLSIISQTDTSVIYQVALMRSGTYSSKAMQTYSTIIGNGYSDNYRSNAYTLDWEGNAWFAGDVYVGSTSGTNKDEGSVRLVTEDQLTFCARVLIRPTQNDDGTIAYSASFPALFVYGEIFEGHPVDPDNSVECCLIPIERNGPLTVLNYTGMSIDQNSDGNIVLTVRFSSYVSGKHISAEIKDTISGFRTDNEELLSTVVTVTEEPVVTEVFSLPLDDSDPVTKGSDGLVPGPTLQERYKFLRADGKWVDLLFCYGDWNEVYKSLIKGEIRSIFTIGSYNNTQSGTPETLGVLYYNGTNGPKLNYTMFGHDGVIYDIDFNRQYNTFSSMALTNKPLPAPTTAQVGQIVSVKSIDESGKVTETETVDMPNRLDVTVSMGDNGFVVSHKFAEIKAAYDAGRAVQLIDTDTFKKYSLMNFYSGSSEGITDAYFKFIDSAGDIWVATINSNDEIDFFQEGTFITLYGDIPQDTPKAITYSVVNGIGYADFIPYIEIPSTGDELKERLVISPAYFYVMPNAYAPFVLKNLVNPYTLTRLSYSEPKSGTEDNTYEASYLVTDSLGQQIKATCQVLLTESGLGDLVWNFEVRDSLIVKSSTEGSTKKFKITVDDSGTMSATEITN